MGAWDGRAVVASGKSMKLPPLSVRVLGIALVCMLGMDLVLGIAVLALWPSVSTSADLSALAVDPTYMTVAFTLGTLTTAMGGAICARLAPSVPYWHAAAFGVLSIVAGLLLSDSSQPTWFAVLATIVTIPAALFGANRRLKARR